MRENDVNSVGASEDEFLAQWDDLRPPGGLYLSFETDARPERLQMRSPK